MTDKPNGDQKPLPLDQRVTTLQIRVNMLERDLISLREAFAHMRTLVSTAEKMRR